LQLISIKAIYFVNPILQYYILITVTSSLALSVLLNN